MGSTYSILADGHHWGDLLRLVEPGDPSETLLCLVSHRHRAGGMESGSPAACLPCSSSFYGEVVVSSWEGGGKDILVLD